MKETLHVPEEHLADTVKVVRAGLEAVRAEIDPDVVDGLSDWCDDEERYLERLAERGQP